MAEPENPESAPPLTLPEVARIVAADQIRLFLSAGAGPFLEVESWPRIERADPIERELVERVRLGREVCVARGDAREGPRIAAPLLLGTRLLGALTASRSPGRPSFTADDGEIAAAIAERMAIDLERARSLQLEVHAQELARSEQAAVAASQAKSAFLAHISHEIRTPLNAIIGYSELLEEEFIDQGDDRYVADVVRIQGAAKHLLALLNDMLDLSKIEAGKMEVEREPFALDELIEEVSATARPLIERGRSSLEVAAATSLGTMIGDRRKTAQVLLNLLSNAGKFTADGAVALTVSRALDGRGEWVIFEVRDSGIGIAAEQLDRIFDAYAQAEGAATSRRFGGTGLGLALCRRLCEVMGGTIEARSTPGVGSTFTVRLPARAG